MSKLIRKLDMNNLLSVAKKIVWDNFLEVMCTHKCLIENCFFLFHFPQYM